MKSRASKKRPMLPPQALALLFFLALVLPPVFLFFPLLFHISFVITLKPREPAATPVAEPALIGLHPRGPPY